MTITLVTIGFKKENSVINIEPHDVKVIVSKVMNKPEVKRLMSVVFNGIVTIDVKSVNHTEVETDWNEEEVTHCNKLDVTTLDGAFINDLFVGEKMCAKLKPLVGKIVDITYKECIAGITEYMLPDDISDAVYTHSVDHKQIVDVAITSDINLLLACTKAGLKAVFKELKDTNHA